MIIKMIKFEGKFINLFIDKFIINIFDWFKNITLEIFIEIKLFNNVGNHDTKKNLVNIIKIFIENLNFSFEAILVM